MFDGGDDDGYELGGSYYLLGTYVVHLLLVQEVQQKAVNYYAYPCSRIIVCTYLLRTS